MRGQTREDALCTHRHSNKLNGHTEDKMSLLENKTLPAKKQQPPWRPLWLSVITKSRGGGVASCSRGRLVKEKTLKS